MSRSAIRGSSDKQFSVLCSPLQERAAISLEISSIRRTHHHGKSMWCQNSLPRKTKPKMAWECLDPSICVEFNLRHGTHYPNNKTKLPSPAGAIPARMQCSNDHALAWGQVPAVVVHKNIYTTLWQEVLTKSQSHLHAPSAG